MTKTLRASCLCGSITFRIHGTLRDARFCHCSKCTKFAGTSPAAWAMTTRSSMEMNSDTGGYSQYNSGRGIRHFCSTCGSPLWFTALADPDIIMIPLGVLDEPDLAVPQSHLFTDSQPSWSCVHR